jgi:hypothetical protein
MEPTSDEKYIVIKREEFERLLDRHDPSDYGHQMRSTVNDLLAKRIPDAVVIRMRDVFAAPGLEAYAGVVQTAIEICKFQGFVHLGGTPVKRLQSIADYFHDRAHQARLVQTKRVPD